MFNAKAGRSLADTRDNETKTLIYIASSATCRYIYIYMYIYIYTLHCIYIYICARCTAYIYVALITAGFLYVGNNQGSRGSYIGLSIFKCLKSLKNCNFSVESLKMVLNLI